MLTEHLSRTPTAPSRAATIRERSFRLAALLLASALAIVGADLVNGSSTPLLDAAQSGDFAAATRLLSVKGTNVNAAGPDGSTAIMYAAANGDVEMVRALIKAGA